MSFCQQNYKYICRRFETTIMHIYINLPQHIQVGFVENSTQIFKIFQTFRSFVYTTVVIHMYIPCMHIIFLLFVKTNLNHHLLVV